MYNLINILLKIFARYNKKPQSVKKKKMKNKIY